MLLADIQQDYFLKEQFNILGNVLVYFVSKN